MDKYKLSIDDINKNYFHFTKNKNLASIKDKGLIPKIGFHAQALEKTKKVFFVEGLDNLICLLDCWINVCEKYPHIPGFFNIGSVIMRYKWFPKSIIYAYFKYTEINKIHRFVAYKYFDKFLSNFILLKIDIKDGVDFSYEDIDQIKNKHYRKEYLIKAGYSPLYSDLESVKMDKWNMHTFSNHGVDKSKIKICYINNSSSMFDILMFAVKNTKMNIEEVCPVLWKYLKNRKLV